MSIPALVFRHVTVRHEAAATPTIADASFSVDAGERVALVGLNGSGKTTTLMAAVGLVAHEGEIEVCGTLLGRKSMQQVRDRIGFLFNVPEDQLLFPKVIDDVSFALLRKKMLPSEAHDRTMGVLKALGVDQVADSPLHHLSHGQKQRVALAGALVAQPPLLLLDEPSAALDPPGKRSLAGLLDGVAGAMVVATHDLEFATRFCHRFIMLDRGRIAFDSADASEVVKYWQM